MIYMTRIAYKSNYRSLVELRRAYERLGLSQTTDAREATLLIDEGLNLRWACRTLDGSYEYGEWHIIAHAGELDYPPLRPEEEIWAALLERHPVPDDEHTRHTAQLLGKTVEELHREELQAHYLSPTHDRGLKTNWRLVCWDPIVRDWDVAAQQLADFVRTHKPPRLTPEQRVMEAGWRRVQLLRQLDAAEESLGRLMRNAARAATDSTGRIRRGLKSDLARWTGLSRPTVDEWLASGGCCDDPVDTGDYDLDRLDREGARD